MNVRSAQSEDLKHFLEHALGLKELEESFGFNGYLEDEKEFIQAYSRFLVLAFGGDRHMFYVAEDNGEVVGTLIGGFDTTEAFYKYPIVGRILFIWVDPDCRERGVAKALVEAWEEEVMGRGVRWCYATINQWNSTPQFKLLHHGYHYEFIQLVREF